MPITNPITSTGAVHEIAVDATGGTFTVTWNGYTTDPLDFDVSAGDFSTAMDGITDHAGDCVVTGGPGDAGGTTPYTFTWADGTGDTPTPTTDPSSLTGGAGTADVTTITAGVTAITNPILSIGAHDEPTSPIPNQGDWQWSMMEVAAWMAGEAWSSEPACVSPVIAGVSNGLNDLLPDNDRQALKDFLTVAPAGVIDTVDSGKETDREWLVLDWLVRGGSYGYPAGVPRMIRDYVSGGTVPDIESACDDLEALPVCAPGTYDEAATLDAIRAAGAALWAERDRVLLTSFDSSGAGSRTFTSYFPVGTGFDYLGADTLNQLLNLYRGNGYTNTGADNGALAMVESMKAFNQAAWDAAVERVPDSLFTGRLGTRMSWQGGSFVAGCMWLLAREAVWVAGISACQPLGPSILDESITTPGVAYNAARAAIDAHVDPRADLLLTDLCSY